ncbi:MAG: hypothetical protein M3Q69_15775 [Acidobacteriota bacterium]|nr:hypothetical protein [Acidobacteriota bacterium]
MRKFIMSLLCCVFAAASLAAQEPESGRPVRIPNEVGVAVFNYSKRLELLTKGIKRDAFIVAQMVKATGDLKDFQKNAAIEKAIERTDDALRRAREQPVAGGRTLTALSKIAEELQRARSQSAMADLDALSKFIVDQTHFIQQDLAMGVAIGRRERESLVDLQKKLADLNLDLEAGMFEALTSTMDLVRAGGH